MSGTVDTSQPADRVRFAMLARAPELAVNLLGLTPNATFAQCAALLQLRWGSGQAAF